MVAGGKGIHQQHEAAKVKRMYGDFDEARRRNPGGSIESEPVKVRTWIGPGEVASGFDLPGVIGELLNTIVD